MTDEVREREAHRPIKKRRSMKFQGMRAEFAICFVAATLLHDRVPLGEFAPVVAAAGIGTFAFLAGQRIWASRAGRDTRAP